MAKQKKSTGQSAKTGRYVIGSAGFAKISAVEGIHLTDAMKERAAVKRAKASPPKNIAGQSSTAIARVERAGCMMRSKTRTPTRIQPY